MRKVSLGFLVLILLLLTGCGISVENEIEKQEISGTAYYLEQGLQGKESYYPYIDGDVIQFLEGKTALSPYANVVYSQGQKQDCDISCIIKGDEALVSFDTFEKLFGVAPEISGDEIKVGNVSFMLGQDKMTVAGQEIAIETGAIKTDEIIMLPARAYGINVLGELFYDDNHGMFIVSDYAMDLTADSLTKGPDGMLLETNRYLFFNRYSAEELLSKMKENLNGDLTAHPRLLATKEDFDRIREDVKTDPYMKKWYELLMYDVDQLLPSNEVPAYDLQDGRILGEGNATVAAVMKYGMAYQLTGEEKYADAAIKYMENACNYPNWLPEKHLDTAEFEMAIAIGFDWCYDAMTEEQRQTIYEKSRALGADETRKAWYSNAEYSAWWSRDTTNWPVTIGGAVVGWALATAEYDPEYNMDMVVNGLRLMEYPVYRIAPDGAWHEGPGYWGGTIGYLTCGMAYYENVIGEPYEALYHKGMEDFAWFSTRLSDSAGQMFTFNDGSNAIQDSPARLYISRKLDLPELTKSYTDYYDMTDYQVSKTTNRTCVFNLLWYDSQLADNASVDEVDLDCYLREIEYVSMRQSYEDPNALWVGVDAGDANSAHSHFDTGSFQLSMNGVRWACDSGTDSGNYESNSSAVQAGYTRMHYYSHKVDGHNMVAINPDKKYDLEKEPVAQMELVSGIGRAYATTDLTEVYGQRKVKNYVRGYLVSEGRRAFTVRDEIELAKDSSDVYWLMQTDGVVRIVDDTTAIITKSGEQLLVRFAVEGDVSDVKLTAENRTNIVDLGFKQDNLPGKRLTLYMKGSGEIAITAKMSIYREPTSKTAIETTPIAEWTVEGDDTITVNNNDDYDARLEGLKVNGVEIENFDPDNFEQTFYAIEGGANIDVEPIFSGQSEVELIDEDDKYATFDVRIYNEAGYMTLYSLKITKTLVPEEYCAYRVVSSDVSYEQTVETSSRNCLRYDSYDGDISTRWAAPGYDGQWLMHDLGEVKELTAIGISWHDGNVRTDTFDLQVSADGENWVDIFTKKISSGNTLDVQIFDFDKPVKARYVKYTGYGNSKSEWNSVTEMISLGRR